MLEKPDIPDETLIASVLAAYRLPILAATFLPLGADPGTAVYRLSAADRTDWFLKLRRGAFDEVSVILPKYLAGQGVPHLLPPLDTASGQPWTRLGEFTLILYPFVEGWDGYALGLSDSQWVELGAALRRIHAAALPAEISARIPRESWSPEGRRAARRFLDFDAPDLPGDPLASRLAAFLKGRRAEVLTLVGQAERLAHTLQARASEPVVCHSDLHAGNLLIAAGGTFFIVDWDSPILAPKERDLMYAGGGQFGTWRSPQEEEALFYQGYGRTEVDAEALAYYRCERIVQDLAVECEQIFQQKGIQADREQAFEYLTANFLPGGTLETARRPGPSTHSILE
jgi:spectinomycin phosphotransferase